jgi:hypothetical protein
MHEVFDANRKYVRYNKRKKVEHLDDDFDQIFPPIKGNEKHALVKNKIINEKLWNKYKGVKCSPEGQEFVHNIYPGFMDQSDSICATTAHAYETFKELYDNFFLELNNE